MEYEEAKHDEITEDLTDVKTNHRFMCSMCKSEDVKVAPMFGGVSKCWNCGHKWQTPNDKVSRNQQRPQNDE